MLLASRSKYCKNENIGRFRYRVCTFGRGEQSVARFELIINLAKTSFEFLVSLSVDEIIEQMSTVYYSDQTLPLDASS
jgi:hypothetical protein